LLNFVFVVNQKYLIFDSQLSYYLLNFVFVGLLGNT